MRNRRFGRVEALKILRTSEAVDHDFATRSLQEVQLAGSPEHPNIASVHDAGESAATVLAGEGVPKERMKVQGFGKEYPIDTIDTIDTNDTAAGRAVNRRTEFVLPQ